MRTRAATFAAVLAAAGCSRGGETGAALRPDASPTEAYRELDAVPGAGTVSGRVTIAGPVPKLKPRAITQDQDACGGAEHPNRSLLLSEGGVANAVVILDGVAAGKRFAPVPALLDQKGCEYQPTVQILPAGRVLTVRNSDPVNHNVHAYGDGNATLFNIGTPLVGSSAERKLTQPGPVRFKCDVHPWMLGWVFVVETPYAAVTGADGRYSLDGVPSGTYRLRVWHEVLGQKEETVTVPAGGRAVADVALSVLGS